MPLSMEGKNGGAESRGGQDSYLIQGLKKSPWLLLLRGCLKVGFDHATAPPLPLEFEEVFCWRDTASCCSS